MQPKGTQGSEGSRGLGASGGRVGVQGHLGRVTELLLAERLYIMFCLGV